MKFIIPAFLILLGMTITSCTSNLPDDVAAAYRQLPKKIDFNYHVKPILSDKCFGCHGPDKQKQEGGLRLDLAESAFEYLISGNIPIVPQSPNKSEVVKRILTRDSELQMPPPESHLTLTNREKGTLIKWIKQGAIYDTHWSFIPPKKIAVSIDRQNNWIKNEIDVFVKEQLDQKKLQPNQKATKETLIRRVSFGLTGLPPTLEEIDGFLEDTSPNAYEKLVDKLLHSPQYGERMAAEWLDVARYADSDGYLDDKHRDFSPWRDWVIAAFNKNISYEEFVTLQLAGDLTPNAKQAHILPTAFNRLHKKNSEAGIVFEEFRSEYVSDRTNTFGKAFLGLTMECAKCHDHKYDPVSQKNYFELYSFFNSTNELGTAIYGPGQTPGPSLLLTTTEQSEIIDFLDNKIQDQILQLKESQTKSTEQFKIWVRNPKAITQSLKNNINHGLIGHFSFDTFEKKGEKWLNFNQVNPKSAASLKEPIIKDGYKGKAFFINDFSQLILPKHMGWFDHTDPFSIAFAIFPDTLYEEVGIFYHCENLRLGLKGYSLFLENNHLKFIIANSYPQQAIQVKTSQPIPIKKWSNIVLTYDGSGQAAGIQLYLNGQAFEIEPKGEQLYKSILFVPDIHTYGFQGFTMGYRDKMKTFLQGGVDELKIYNRTLSALEVVNQHQPTILPAILSQPDEHKNKALLSGFYYKNIDKKSHIIQLDIKALRKKLVQEVDTIPEIMVMGDMPESRPTYVLERGMYDSPREEVFPTMPDKILPFEESLPKNRMGLAKWLFDKKNPLTARVFVNRIWQMHFGNGLVSTPDDFGNQGDLPSHPGLLDWLAVTFMESGWDIKQLHRIILNSATYQQSSKATAELLAIDTNNRLLARGPSFRLPAEMIRDNALAISDLLVDKLGGKSVYPYQPAGLWDEVSNKSWRYPYLESDGEGLYRRSLYTIWKRTSPPPYLINFDAADRGVCTVKRGQTSTPLQALTLLNDPQFIEAARVTASHIQKKEKDITQQLIHAFRLGTGRLPREEELKTLTNFYQAEHQRFLQEREATSAYLGIGKKAYAADSNPVELAALATVINGIMNTVEGYTLK